MNIVEIDFDPLPVLIPRDRSDGLHVSQIIRDIVYGGEELQDKSNNYFIVGLAWELAVELFHANNPDIERPGEFVVDGIILSPDAFNTRDWTVEEWKCTWRSSSKWKPEDFQIWWMQVKAYCRALNTDRAILRALFVNGDWKKSGPAVKAWSAEFSRMELDENWEMIINHARWRGWIR